MSHRIKFYLKHPGETDDLAPKLGCTSLWLNDCYCCNDLASSTSSSFTSCVDRGCFSNLEDVGRAMSIYDGCCGNNNNNNAPATISASPTTDGTAAAAMATVRVMTAVVSSSNTARSCAKRGMARMGRR